MSSSALGITLRASRWSSVRRVNINSYASSLLDPHVEHKHQLCASAVGGIPFAASSNRGWYRSAQATLADLFGCRECKQTAALIVYCYEIRKTCRAAAQIA